jgi:hypothetical protein
MSNVAKAINIPKRIFGRKYAHSGIANVLDPGGRVTTNVEEGKPLTGRSLLDPAGVVLQTPPGAPPPPPTFPDTAGAEIAARRNVRRRAISSGLGGTVLTGNYSPTGQASPVLGGG